MIQIARYRHSKQFKSGLPAIVGPRSYTNAQRRWQARISVNVPTRRIEIHDQDLQAVDTGGVFTVPDSPVALVYENRPEQSMTVNIGVLSYSQACEVIADQMQELLRECPDWTDFEWQVWTEKGKAPKVRRAG
jgi:hypothetical protein